MKEIKVNNISKDLEVSHSAVSQWFSGKTKPTITNVIKMNELYNIPFEAWKDIKSYINGSITACNDTSKIENNNKTIKENI
jgi:transcriptional regulator with XRE-family HTH domain